MNLIKFAIKTSPSILYVAGVFLLGSSSIAYITEAAIAVAALVVYY